MQHFGVGIICATAAVGLDNMEKYSLTIEDSNTSFLQALLALADVLHRSDPTDNVIDFSDPTLPIALLGLLVNLKNSIWHQSIGAEKLASDEALQALWAQVWKEHYSLQQGINRRTGKAVGP